MASLAIKEQKIEGLSAGEPVPEYIRIQAFAVKKGDFELLAKLNQGLEIIKSNGEYNRIYDRWLLVGGPSDKFWASARMAYAVAAAALLLVIALIIRSQTRKKPGAA